MNVGPAPDPQKELRPSLEHCRTIKIFGLGGVGGIVARHLILFLGSLQERVRVLFIDGDQFEAKNQARMMFSSYGNKAAVLRSELLPLVQGSKVSLEAVEEFVTRENVAQLVQERDTVILAVDNHATRKLLNDHCATLKDVCLVSGGNDGIGPNGNGQFLAGTYGNVQLFLRKKGLDQSPSLTQFHPEIAEPADVLPTDQSCVELMESQPQILFTNLTTASVILNTLWLHLCGELTYGEACFDIHACRMRPAQSLSRPRS